MSEIISLTLTAVLSPPDFWSTWILKEILSALSRPRAAKPIGQCFTAKIDKVWKTYCKSKPGVPRDVADHHWKSHKDEACGFSR